MVVNQNSATPSFPPTIDLSHQVLDDQARLIFYKLRYLEIEKNGRRKNF